MKVKYNVKGMSCSACAVGIEKSLMRVSGIRNAEVSLMTETMVVDFDSKYVDSDKIIENVNKLGYTASVYGEQFTEKSIDNPFMRFVASLILLIPLMYFSMGGMFGFSLPNTLINYSVQFVLTSVILGINYRFFTNGFNAVRNKSANMDTLVALSAGGSFLFSLVASIVFYVNATYSGHLFFESAAMVVTLVTLGKWLEDKSKRKTGKEIEKLSKLVPKTVTVLIDGIEREIATSMVKIGDVLLFRTGDYVAVDGVAREGVAFVDKAAITGESMPVEVIEGEEVVSGSIIVSGYVEVVAKKVGDDTLFSKIIESVRAAGTSKAPVQKFADNVAGVFVPVVAILAVVTFAIWMPISKDIFVAFNYALSVLVISCPCALGLATPVAIMATTGKAAALGILYKDAETIQKAQSINCVMLDKTATITEGKPQVVETVYYTDENHAKSIASAIESKSTHPLAICIRDYAGESDFVCESYSYIAGKGAVAVIDGVEYFLGNDKLVKSNSFDLGRLAKDFSDKGYTTVYLSNDNELLAAFAISDTIKTDSVEAVRALNEYGIQTVMVTGDNKGAANAIAKKAGIADFVAEVLPDGKVDVVKEYKNKGNFVAMVGDGINDSPAIKSADVGIAVGTGTDIAIDSADIVIAGGSLKGILDAITLSKKSNHIVKGNLFWAFFYNVIAIPVAAGALSALGVVLTPSIAAACMCLSSLFVVVNALRISAFKSYFVTNGDKSAKSVLSANIPEERSKTSYDVARQSSTHEQMHNSNARIEAKDYVQGTQIEQKAASTQKPTESKATNTLKNAFETKEDNVACVHKTVFVSGMMCMHCANRVRDALMNIDGIIQANVELDSQKAEITVNKSINEGVIEEAIRSAGYTVLHIQ
ncbi:MAG: heavy metal translocating P-type ATPase [Clostridia bacterium]|nr:heavy metal translocating P-type ATPase [Clostridia bacterium]